MLPNMIAKYAYRRLRPLIRAPQHPMTAMMNGRAAKQFKYMQTRLYGYSREFECKKVARYGKGKVPSFIAHILERLSSRALNNRVM